MNTSDKPSWKVSPRLRGHARSLRRNATDAERFLWAALRDHRLNGVSFRRQVPIGPFIADFVCHDAKLVIELDGGQHYDDAQACKDQARTAILAARGYRVLRFSNHDVLTNRTGVLEAISVSLAEATCTSHSPTLTLPRKRERE